MTLPDIDTNLTAAFDKHYQYYLGSEYRVIQTVEGIHVRQYSPTPERPFEVLTTHGLSAKPCTVPDSLADDREFYGDQEWNELMLCLPPTIDPSYRDWAALLLPTLGHAARERHRYVGFGQFFDLTQSPDFPWSAVTLLQPELFPTTASFFRGPLTQRCQWFAAVPVMPEEIKIRRDAGLERFSTALTQSHITELFDPSRVSFLTPRLYA